ncbi:MAG: DUF1385 domain-containing protein, partial [Armatimonadetes bacterium]|nr:DUF1385 domain-containing protein [Armatimonadota bacterium]
YWQIGLNLLMFTCFLLVLRLSPMSGYHAAEHMTVTAIERLGRLTPEEVRRMPRAHPRCGTNLLAAILPTLLIAVPLWPVDPQIATLIAIGGYLARAQIGWALQQFFTTKNPTDAQLEAGLRAGRKILEARKRLALRPQSPAHRLWQRGFPQMAAGVFAAMWVLGWVYEHLHLWLDW